MHDCGLCGQACFCDMDDTDLSFMGVPRGCDHVCEEYEDDGHDDAFYDMLDAELRSDAP